MFTGMIKSSMEDLSFSWNKNRVVGKSLESEIASKTIVISQAGDNAIWTRMVMVELVRCLF